MKKTKRAVGKVRTSIADIAAPTELSVEELELVAGGMLRSLGGSLWGSLGGRLSATTTTTYPGSITNPGDPDTATDTGSD